MRDESFNPAVALRQYNALVPSHAAVQPLGNAGGFSGARIWRVSDGLAQWCLRLWPVEQPSRSRLRWIHGLLQRGRAAGLTFLPAPAATRSGTTVCEAAGRTWELAPWMPGRADFRQHPSARRVRAAAEALAAVHRCWQSGSRDCAVRPSPGLGRRSNDLRTWLAGGLELLRRPSDRSWPELHPLARQWLARFEQEAPRLAPVLDQAARWPVPLQPCIRDIWHDHVLWQDDRVSGIVDFGAADLESVAADLARLFGSLIAGDRDLWPIAIEAYDRVRPLSAAERDLVEVFDRSTTLLAPGRWFRWCLVEHRRFEDARRVVAQVERLLARAPHPCGVEYAGALIGVGMVEDRHESAAELQGGRG